MAKASTKRAPRRASDTPGDELGVADLARRVAENLRTQRKNRDLSLDDLARLTGVSRAALSQIETRKTNPSIGVLWKIAAGLAYDALAVRRCCAWVISRSAASRFCQPRTSVDLPGSSSL